MGRAVAGAVHALPLHLPLQMINVGVDDIHFNAITVMALKGLVSDDGSQL